VWTTFLPTTGGSVTGGVGGKAAAWVFQTWPDGPHKLVKPPGLTRTKLEGGARANARDGPPRVERNSFRLSSPRPRARRSALACASLFRKPAWSKAVGLRRSRRRRDNELRKNMGVDPDDAADQQSQRHAVPEYGAK